MKKIIGGILGIFLVIGIVAGAGYAVFTDQVTMTGMVLGTATPSLKIAFYDKATDLPDTNFGYQPTLNFSATGQGFQKLLPGESDWGAFFIKNDSLAGSVVGLYDPLDFTLKGSIVTADGDWDILKNVVKMKVCVVDKAQNNYCDTSKDTNWYTLAEWKSEAKSLPGGVLYQTDPERAFVVVFKLDESYGNTYATKTITGMTMQVTGTQVVYAD